jgi:hypothetical protein
MNKKNKPNTKPKSKNIIGDFIISDPLEDLSKIGL